MATSPFLHPFARPAKDDFISIVRGSRAPRVRRRRAAPTSTAWPASGTRTSATAGRRWPTPSPPRSARSRPTPASTRSRTRRPTSCADLLATWSPLPGTRVFFTSSGSEAVDSAHQAGPHRAGAGRPPRAHEGREPHVRLPRRHLRRPRARRACRPTRPASGPLLPGLRQPAEPRPRGDGRAVRRAGRRDRGRDHRARAGRGRRPAAASTATWPACAASATSTAPTSSWTR